MWALAVVAGMLVVLWVRWRRSGQPLDVYLAMAVTRQYVSLWHRWSSNGRAQLPAAGPAILISNHTCSADPTFLAAGCDRLLSFVVAREHYHVAALDRRFLSFLQCVPVTRNGRDVG